MLRDTIACDLCGGPITAHHELLGAHLHPPITPEQVKQAEWRATKALNPLQQRVERQEKANRWRPPLQRLVQMKVRYVG
jgi:hypothetical protein